MQAQLCPPNPASRCCSVAECTARSRYGTVSDINIKHSDRDTFVFVTYARLEHAQVHRGILASPRVHIAPRHYEVMSAVSRMPYRDLIKASPLDLASSRPRKFKAAA